MEFLRPASSCSVAAIEHVHDTTPHNPKITPARGKLSDLRGPAAPVPLTRVDHGPRHAPHYPAYNAPRHSTPGFSCNISVTSFAVYPTAHSAAVSQHPVSHCIRGNEASLLVGVGVEVGKKIIYEARGKTADNLCGARTIPSRTFGCSHESASTHFRDSLPCNHRRSEVRRHAATHNASLAPKTARHGQVWDKLYPDIAVLSLKLTLQ